MVVVESGDEDAAARHWTVRAALEARPPDPRPKAAQHRSCQAPTLARQVLCRSIGRRKQRLKPSAGHFRLQRVFTVRRQRGRALAMALPQDLDVSLKPQKIHPQLKWTQHTLQQEPVRVRTCSCCSCSCSQASARSLSQLRRCFRPACALRIPVLDIRCHL
jgi:hypothetical protein